jgi:hypothetical protein
MKYIISDQIVFLHEFSKYTFRLRGAVGIFINKFVIKLLFYMDFSCEKVILPTNHSPKTRSNSKLEKKRMVTKLEIKAGFH